jgi:hypothetical protein
LIKQKKHSKQNSVNNMPKKSTILIAAVIILLLVAGGVYWYLFFYGPGNKVTPTVTGTRPTNGFTPFTSSPPSTGNGTVNNNAPTPTPTVSLRPGSPIPSLRLLSNTPIGGYGASTTASTTVVRWIDRGRGNIYEARGDSIDIATISNTILPRMYESVWNKGITAFIGSILPANADLPTTVYAEIKSILPPADLSITPKPLSKANKAGALKQASTTIPTPTATPAVTEVPANQTPFELKGKNLPDNMIGFAASPKGDKVFMLVKENNSGVGYIANFNGTSVTKIFTSPLTQVNVDWPEDTTIAITTKGSASQSGFLYFVNTKTGVWKKVLGPILGLSAKVSHNAKYVIASGSSSNQSITTNLYAVGTTTPILTPVRTLVDKCVWGNFYKELVYCATPTDIPAGTYPDDWYKGAVSFSDKIWQINVTNGEVHLVTTIVDQSDRIVDAFNLGLDSKDDFLFFMNKDDLSFWSFDLSARQ